MNTLSKSLLTVALLVVRWTGEAVAPLPEEMAEVHRWTAAKLGQELKEIPPEPAVIVRANHDPVQKNSRAGKPLRIADAPYARGLYCHAPSELEVRLPGPAESFTAIIGVDSNSQTSGGRGSVEFAVTVDDQERFRSDVLREGMTGRPVRVNLGGASAFVLRIEPTAEGIACDQDDWAEATVTLRDGR